MEFVSWKLGKICDLNHIETREKVGFIPKKLGKIISYLRRIDPSTLDTREKVGFIPQVSGTICDLNHRESREKVTSTLESRVKA